MNPDLCYTYANRLAFLLVLAVMQTLWPDRSR